jgi:negative regulator of sigma-B (phosphoserine phosphatase)
LDLTIAHLTRPCAGEQVNGDAIVVRREPEATLVTVVDALGHGPDAASAAGRATAYLADAPLSGTASEIVDGLHTALGGTRGAAALVCLLRGSVLRTSGIGNVELRSLSGTVGVPLTPGILGRRVRRLVEYNARLAPGERLALFSDGISARMSLQDHRDLPARAACEEILRCHGRAHDDASVVIVDVGRIA